MKMPTKTKCEELLKVIRSDPEKEEIEYVTKAVLLKKISGLKEGTLSDYLADCRDNFPEENTVLNPSHKICLINYRKFEQYLIWRSANRMKARKIEPKGA